MKINVLHISTAQSWRGGELQVQYLINTLNKYSNINQILLCVKDSELSKRIKNCKVITKNKPIFISFNWVNAIQKICNSEQIDVIHVHESKAQTFAVLSSLFNDKKIIVTRRVIFPVTGCLSKKKYTHKSIKKVVCISNAVKKEMRKVVNSNKLTIIGSSVDVNKFSKNSSSINFPFLNTNKIKIAYISALTEEKDHITFIKTAKKIIEKRKDVIFYIVGEGKLKEELQHYVQKINLEKSILFTGFIREIPQLIPKLDMLLFTSKKEGLGSTVLDFFSAKKPVVATDSGGIKDILIHQKTGLLANVGDVDTLAKLVIEVLDNQTLKNTLVNNAYQLVLDNYSLKSLGVKYAKLYEEVMKND